MKYQLVLAGGGARGSYQVGVWKALRELNIEIDMVIGTSVGSVNGAAVVCDAFVQAEHLWKTLDMPTLFDITYNKEDGEPNSSEYIESILKNKGLDTSTLKCYLEQVIDEDVLRNSPIDYALVTFSLTQMKPVILFKKDIPKGKVVDFILASSAVPGFKKQEIDGELYIDGGIYDNLPINILIDHGYKNIIAVSNAAIGVYRKVKESDANIMYIENQQIQGGILEFDPQIAAKNILLGYLDGMKAFGKYIGQSYYISDTATHDYAKPLTEKEIEMLYLNVKNNKKNIMGSVVQFSLLRTLRHHTDGLLTAKKVFFAAMEITADTFGIEKIRPYTPEQLITKIMAAYRSAKSEHSQIMKEKKNFVKNLLGKIWDKNKIRINSKAARKLFLGHVLIDKENPSISSNTTTEYLISNLFIYLMLWRRKKIMKKTGDKNGRDNQE